MSDKIQKIREDVERLKSQLLRGACSSQIAIETRCKEEAYNEVLAILDTMQEEPVSEELLKASMEFAKHFGEWDYAMPCFQAGANWREEQMMAKAVDGVVHHFDGCEWASVHYNDPKGVPMTYFVSSEGLSAGDKVKIILAKEG